MSWRPTGPYTVTFDPTLWSHPDLRHIPAEQRPGVVTDDHTAERDPDGTWQIRIGPAYQADMVRTALDQGDDLPIARYLEDLCRLATTMTAAQN